MARDTRTALFPNGKVAYYSSRRGRALPVGIEATTVSGYRRTAISYGLACSAIAVAATLTSVVLFVDAPPTFFGGYFMAASALLFCLLARSSFRKAILIGTWTTAGEAALVATPKPDHAH